MPVKSRLLLGGELVAVNRSPALDLLIRRRSYPGSDASLLVKSKLLLGGGDGLLSPAARPWIYRSISGPTQGPVRVCR